MATPTLPKQSRRRAKTTTTEPAPTSVSIPREQGFERFQQVLDTLRLAGFNRLRIDTYQHVKDAGIPDNRERWTVRHRFDHGVWELHYEPDRYWSHGDLHPEARMAKIRLDRDLPTVEQVLNDLFGKKIGRYFPARRRRTT